MKPRNTPQGTLAEGQFQRTLWAEYVRAYLIGGTEEIIGDASVVFTEKVLDRLQIILSEEALATPVLFTEMLSNQTLAGCIGFRDKTQVVAINSRCKADPEVLAHALVEEFVHAQQRLDGVNFDEQRRQFAYQERPYEQEAKRIATETLGYEPDEFETYIVREEPTGALYDRLGLN